MHYAKMHYAIEMLLTKINLNPPCGRSNVVKPVLKLFQGTKELLLTYRQQVYILYSNQQTTSCMTT